MSASTALNEVDDVAEPMSGVSCPNCCWSLLLHHRRQRGVRLFRQRWKRDLVSFGIPFAADPPERVERLRKGQRNSRLGLRRRAGCRRRA